jgi:ribose 1,5-bisphosphokinase
MTFDPRSIVPSRAAPSEGALGLVVGPSGAGKDSLLAAARRDIGDDPRFVFPRRVITRAAQADAEDHDTMEPADFEAAEAEGAFVLSWRAHGLAYGIGREALDDVLGGRIVVINVSRGVIPRAERIASRTTVLNVTARPEVLAERIARRGRETAAEIEARLRREAPIAVTTARLIDIRNETTLDEAARAFVAALRSA